MTSTDFVSVCGGKTPYPSRQAARESADHRRVDGKMPGKVETYNCPYADPSDPHWHFGHVSRARAHRRRRRKVGQVERYAQ